MSPAGRGTAQLNMLAVLFTATRRALTGGGVVYMMDWGRAPYYYHLLLLLIIIITLFIYSVTFVDDRALCRFIKSYPLDVQTSHLARRSGPSPRIICPIHSPVKK